MFQAYLEECRFSFPLCPVFAPVTLEQLVLTQSIVDKLEFDRASLSSINMTLSALSSGTLRNAITRTSVSLKCILLNWTAFSTRYKVRLALFLAIQECF